MKNLIHVDFRSYLSSTVALSMLVFIMLGVSACENKSEFLPETVADNGTAVLTPTGYAPMSTEDAVITTSGENQPQTDNPLFTIFFTDPYGPGAEQRSGGLDEDLATAIDQASQSVYIAVYSLSLESVSDALLRAYQRGVDVRLVLDDQTMDRTQPKRLLDHNVPIIADRKASLMHNKFIIIDGQEVWTGSLNLTVSGVYADHNNMVRIRSTEIIQNYLTEFTEMYENGLYGAGSPANTPFPVVTADGRLVEVYFSPDDGVAEQLIEMVSGAAQSIDFLAFSFTSDDLAEAMISRDTDGVRVRGVFEEAQVKSNIGGEYDHLRQAGLDVHLDGNPGQMHHKVIIVDGEIVSFGSYNFSYNAENKNDENVMIVYDPELAGQFEAEFELIYARAQP